MAGVFLKNGLPGWSGLEAGFHRLEAGHETILHRHNFYELEIVTRGRGLHRIHGRALPFSAGECWLIGGIDSHGISCETEVEVANLSFRGDSLPEEIGFLLETRSLCCRFPTEELASPLRKFEMLATARPEELFARAWSGALLLELLIEVVRKADPGYVAPPPLVRSAAAWAQKHCRDDASLTALAAELSLSPNHLGKLFRDATGMSFSAYVTGIRLNRACFLLTNTDMPLKELAFEAGFRSPEYFHRVFREQLLCTPAGYRRDARREAAGHICSN